MKHHLKHLAAVVSFAGTFAVTLVATGGTTLPAHAAGTRYVDMVFDTTTVASNVVYATAPALVTGVPTDLLLDVYQPVGDTSTSRPVLIAIHGGGFKTGSKATLSGIAQEWARRGYVVFSLNYRLDAGNQCQAVQDGKVPPSELAAEAERCRNAVEAAQYDSQAAIRWVRAHAGTYGIDATRVAVMGSSAGAVTALNLAYQSDTPGDVGDYDGYDSAIGAALVMSGCGYDPSRIGAGDAAVAMIHAELDGAVPMQCAIATAAIARSRGLVAETMLWYGEGTHAKGLYEKYQSTIDPVWTQFLIRELSLTDGAAPTVVPPNSTTEIRGTPNRSAVVSLVATGTAGGGYLQALPCTAAAGSTSNLNTDAAGQTRAGLAVVRFDAGGAACVYNSMATHVVVDLQGYLAEGAFDDVTDARLLDTRSGSTPRAGSMAVLRGEPNRSAVLSLVASGSLGSGFLQALPCGSAPGATSNLNLDAAGQTRSGLAIVPFGADGTVCLYTSATTHLLVDLQGYFTAGTFDDIADARLLDTRAGARAAAGGTTVIRGNPGSSAFVSLIATGSLGSGYLTALPCDATPGITSNLNIDAAGLTIAGTAVVRFDTEGEACIYSSVATHLVVDLQGYFSAGSFDDIADARLLDTRGSG